MFIFLRIAGPSIIVVSVDWLVHSSVVAGSNWISYLRCETRHAERRFAGQGDIYAAFILSLFVRESWVSTNGELSCWLDIHEARSISQVIHLDTRRGIGVGWKKVLNFAQIWR